MANEMSVEERIALGIDEAWRGDLLEANRRNGFGQAMLQPDGENVYPGFDQDVAEANAVRAGILRVVPYVEGAIIGATLWPKNFAELDYSAQQERIRRRLGFTALSINDHGDQLFPIFQFMTTKLYVVHDVVGIVNAVRDWQRDPPQTATSWADVSWWTRRNRYLHSNNQVAPKDLVADPSSHFKIVRAAYRERLDLLSL